MNSDNSSAKYPSRQTVRTDKTATDPISFDLSQKASEQDARASVAPSTVAPSTTDETVVRLVEERLVVDRSKRKVGDVIVRKVVETRMVEVPVRRERLIVEQVGSETRQLAAIDLGEGEITGVDWSDASSSKPALDPQRTISGDFTSLEIASQVLSHLASNLKGHYENIHLEITLKDQSLQEPYQAWLNRQT